MRGRRAYGFLLSLTLLAAGLSSCLARRRVITRAGGKGTPSLLVADKKALIESIARQYAAVRDFSATVDMVPALGTTEKNRITEYKDVRGYIVFRKPFHIRIIGLMPVVRNKAFDMVSEGGDFKLYVPVRNRFIVGPGEVSAPSANKLENLRPKHFLDALMVQPVDAEREQALIENFTDEDNAAYLLHLVRRNGNGELALARTVWFSRLDLRMARQIIFDETGNILTDARYSDWREYDNVPFPRHVEINRPRDEYAVVVDIVKMDVNKGVGDDKFVLEQPEGSTLQAIGGAAPAPPPKAKPRPASKGKTRKK